jgi:transcriptional regulator with XRE-family HTH domain
MTDKSTNDEAGGAGDVGAVIARHVRAARAARGWSLDGLATRSGVSKGMLVQIEQGRANPSIATLVRVANALGVGVPELLEAAAPPRVRVARVAETPALWEGPRGGAARLLGGFPGRHADEDIAEVWRWSLATGEAYAAEPHQAGTREALYVTAGTLAVEVEGEAYQVEAEEVLFFRADRAHRYVNVGRRPAEFVMVVLERGGADAGTHVQTRHGRRQRRGAQ